MPNICKAQDWSDWRVKEMRATGEFGWRTYVYHVPTGLCAWDYGRADDNADYLRRVIEEEISKTPGKVTDAKG